MLDMTLGQLAGVGHELETGPLVEIDVVNLGFKDVEHLPEVVVLGREPVSLVGHDGVHRRGVVHLTPEQICGVCLGVRSIFKNNVLVVDQQHHLF